MRTIKSRRKKLKPLAVIFLIALLFRLIYVFQVYENPFYTNLMYDSISYDAIAKEILTNNVEKGVFFQGPLYPLILAAIYRLFGQSTTPVMVIQAAAGAVTCCLTYLLAEKIFNDKTALVAGLITALYGPLIFHSATILTETFSALLLTLLALTLSANKKTQDAMQPAAAGLFIGLLTLFRPNAVILLPVAYGGYYGSAKRFLKAFFFLTACFLVAVAPLIAFNFWSRGALVLTSNFGFNFYVGSNPDANGVFAPLGESIPFSGDFFYLKNGTGYSVLNKGDSPAWLSESMKYISRQPLDYILLEIKKTLLFLNAREYPQVYDYNFLRQQSILKYPFLQFSLLAPLAITGIVLSGKNRKARPALLVLVAYAASIIAFFIIERFRIPLIPLFAAFAAHAASELYASLKGGKRPHRQLIVFAAALILVNNTVYTPDIEGDTMFNPYNNLGVVYMKNNQTRKAADSFLKAISSYPGQDEPYGNLADAYYRLSDYAASRIYAEKSLSIKDNPYARDTLGRLSYQEGDIGQAIVEYQRALEINPVYSEAHANLGAAYFEDGDIRRAVEEFETASRLRPFDATIHYNLGVIYHSQNQTEKALREIGRAAQLDPAFEKDLQDYVGILKTQNSISKAG